MDEDEGSGRWNGQIEAWVPRANRGGQVFSSELRPRSATFHQQNELGVPWASDGSEMARKRSFFRQASSRILWMKADCCLSNMLFIGAPLSLLYYWSTVVKFFYLIQHRSFALATQITYTHNVSVIANCQQFETADNILDVILFLLCSKFFPAQSTESSQITIDRESEDRRELSLELRLSAFSIFQKINLSAYLFETYYSGFSLNVLENPSTILVRRRVSNNLLLMRHYI